MEWETPFNKKCYFVLGERKVYQTLSQMAREIANRRATDTGHGTITDEWERAAKNMEREAQQGAEACGDKVEPIEAPEQATVEEGVGFEEAGEAAEAGAAVAEGVGAEEIIQILGCILLL